MLRNHYDDGRSKNSMMLRREVLAVWVLLSAPLIGFVGYLILALRMQMMHDQLPLMVAMSVAVISLFFLSCTFLSHMSRDWRKCARFMSVAFWFEGIVLLVTQNSGGKGSLYFGVGTIVAGLILYFGSKKN